MGRPRQRPPDEGLQQKPDPLGGIRASMIHDPITGFTKIPGLIADFIGQAPSPSMANEMFCDRGMFGDSILASFHVLGPSVPPLRDMDADH
jgi:hypothetical protein